MVENLQTTTNLNADSTSQITSLTERAFMFLEDSNWESANTYCERILDIEPTNALAYLGKLMSEYKVSVKEELGKLKVALDDNSNYQKIMLFGEEELKDEISKYNEQNIATYNLAKQKKKRSTILVLSILSSICAIILLVWLVLAFLIPTIKYNNAESYLSNGDYQKAISIFTSLEDFKDSVEKNKSSKYKWACELIDAEEFVKAHEILNDLDAYEDSRDLLRDVSWEIIYKYLNNNDTFQFTVETSITAIRAEDDQILLGYAIAFDDSIKVNATYVASIRKDGSVPILGKSNAIINDNSIENVETSGYWDIGTFKSGDMIKWEDVNAERTGLFKYNEETMLEMFTDNAYGSMVIGLQALLEESETGVTIQDLGFYSYE